MTLYENKNEPLTIEELDANFKELDARINSGLTPDNIDIASTADFDSFKEDMISEISNFKSEILQAQQQNGVDTQLADRVSNLENKSIEITDFKMLNVTIDDIAIPANERVNNQTAIPNLLDGYTICAYKQISIAKATNAESGDEGWKKTIIQSFSTSGGETKTNISLYNMGSSATKVKLTAIVLCKYIKTINFTDL